MSYLKTEATLKNLCFTAILPLMTKTATSAISFKTLPNGLRIVHEHMPWLSSVSFSILIPFGATTDPKGFEGSATVLADWLYRGTTSLSSRELSDKIDDLGLRRGGGSGKEYSSFSGSLLASSFKESLKLYASMLQEARFDEEEFSNAQTLAQQELASLADSPSQQLFETLSKRYFSSSHGNSSYGTEAGLKSLTANTLKDFAYKNVTSQGAIFSVAGGVSWTEVLAVAQQLFADKQSNKLPSPKITIAEPLQAHIQEESNQTQIGVAYQSVAPGQTGWYEQAICTSVLSGGMGARLFSEVREKRGLVYSVYAGNRALKDFGYTLAYAGTTPERADETLEVLLHELRRLAHGISQDELERARTGLLSSLVMQGESSGSRASSLARDIFLLGEPREISSVKDALLALTLEQVNGFLASAYAPKFTVLSLGPKALKEVAL